MTFRLLQEKTISWACLVTWGFNDIFLWNIDDRFLDKSLKYTKINRGSMIDPWDMPASTCDDEDDLAYNKTLWNLFDRNLSMHFSGRPDIPKDCTS